MALLNLGWDHFDGPTGTLNLHVTIGATPDTFVSWIYSQIANGDYSEFMADIDLDDFLMAELVFDSATPTPVIPAGWQVMEPLTVSGAISMMVVYRNVTLAEAGSSTVDMTGFNATALRLSAWRNVGSTFQSQIVTWSGSGPLPDAIPAMTATTRGMVSGCGAFGHVSLASPDFGSNDGEEGAAATPGGLWIYGSHTAADGAVHGGSLGTGPVDAYIAHYVGFAPPPVDTTAADVTVTVDWGDGTQEDVIVPVVANGSAHTFPTHTYAPYDAGGPLHPPTLPVLQVLAVTSDFGGGNATGLMVPTPVAGDNYPLQVFRFDFSFPLAQQLQGHPNQVAHPPATATFHADDTYTIPGVSDVDWQWFFEGSNSQPGDVEVDASTPTVQHTYTRPNPWYVRFKVTNSIGMSAWSWSIAWVYDLPSLGSVGGAPNARFVPHGVRV